MLSRLVRPVPSVYGNLAQLSALQSSQVAGVRFNTTSVPAETSSRKGRPTIAEVLRENAVAKIKEGPERDLVNYPRPKRVIDSPACSWGFISENYFNFLYPKLGATGGWTLGIGGTIFLLSKEMWVIEHEWWTGLGIVILYGGIIKLAGPKINTYLENMQQAEADEANEGKYSEIEGCKEAIEEEKHAQWQAEVYKSIYEAKRENVAFQLEAAYRERLMTVYQEVKRRLDYQVEKQNVERNVQQRHMVNWIINKVTKSITSESEQENLKKCIADLKLLAARPA